VARFWAAAALGAALLLPAAQAATPAYGDVDGNGVVDRNDVKLLAQIAGGLAPASVAALRSGDVAPVNDFNAGSFGDGRITTLDVARLARKVNGKEPAEWPAKSSFYQLEAGNTFTTRKYDATGTATTAPDVLSTVQAPVQETVGGVTYIVSPITGSDASEQRLVTAKLDGTGNQVPFTDSQGRPAIGATKFSFGGDVSTFNPPLVLLVYPVQAGTTWTGTTQAVISGYNVLATYTGTITGPEVVDVPAGHFENAYKVTIAYSGSAGFASASGEEYYWFVPFLGPVQHGYTRTITSILGNQVKAVNPDIKLVSANVHGVKYP
jgi:hypothetical protein